MSKEIKILFAIFLLALFLRIIKLGTYPVGFHADEVRVGWNAYSILKTGLDDRENLLALYYNTFGDYRPTGIFYLTIPSIILFGLNIFAVRFPSALFGALTIFPLYFITKKLLDNTKLATFSIILLALSPWHISVSRATSEVVISMFFALSGLYFYLHYFNSKKTKHLIYSSLLILISYLLYHSIRVLAPLFLLAILLFKLQSIKANKLTKNAFYLFLSFTFLTLLLSLNGNSRARLSQVSITNSYEVQQVLSATDTAKIKTLFDNKNFIYFTQFAQEYGKYFSVDFLINSNTKPIRYSTPSIGLLTYSGFIFLLIGVYLAIKDKNYHLILILLLISPLAAALTTEDSPNLHRSLFMLPFLIILMAIGITHFINKKVVLLKTVFRLLIIFYLFNLVQFGLSYTTRAADKIGSWRNYGTYDLVLYLNEVHNNYEEVVVTNDPDDPYPWFAFFNKLDPKKFNTDAIRRSDGPWKYENILFSQSECPSGDIFPGPKQNPLEKNVLVIDGFKCNVESKLSDGMQAKVLKQFFNPDSSLAYTVWVKSEE